MKIVLYKRIIIIAFHIVIIGYSPVNAETKATPTSVVVSVPQTASWVDQTENLGRIYKDEENKVLQELWLLGRYHGHLHWSEGSAGSDDGYETRRFRFGAQARFFEKITLHAQMVSGSDFDPFYNGFTELWAQWAFSPELALTIGQQKHRFTHDRNVSSRYLNYLERSMLTNMFAADYTPAITLQGKIKNYSYYAGIFSNATSSKIGEELTKLDSGYSFLAAVYHNIGKPFRTSTAHVHTSYLHASVNQRATNLNVFDDGLSCALILTKDAGSLVTEVTSGFGSADGSALGINIQPGYFLTHELQIATRFQFALSNNEAGLTPQRRYEKESGLPSGDRYEAAYAGLNYYIAKHRAKLMTGLEYSRMGGEDIWTASTMLRFYFGPHSGGPFPMNQIL
jgi:phosphate-selective porin OprO and OprP